MDEAEQPSRLLRTASVILDWLAIAGAAVTGAIVAAIVMTAILPTKQAAAFVAWEGAESPPFSFVTLEGKQIDSSQLRGKRVLLNFWATWCVPCQLEIPQINRLLRESGESDVVVFGLSSESESTIREFLAKNKVGYPLVSVPKEQLPEPYSDVLAVPTSFVLDRKGVIQFVHTGYVTSDQLKATTWDADDYKGAPTEPFEGEPSL